MLKGIKKARTILRLRPLYPIFLVGLITGYSVSSPLMAASERIYYYHNDYLGTPQYMTDSDQNLVWQAGRDPFGADVAIVADVDSVLRFPGQYHDEETELQYNWNRYYDPVTGRYITSDPIGLEGGLNTYVYALSNPIIFTDISGLDTAGCDIGPFKRFETPCRLECCAAHDQCFYNYNCTARSWWDPTSPCGQCNVTAIRCFVDCQDDPESDDPNRPNYFCAKIGEFIDIPSCEYPDVETAEKKCRN